MACKQTISDQVCTLIGGTGIPQSYYPLSPDDHQILAIRKFSTSSPNKVSDKKNGSQDCDRNRYRVTVYKNGESMDDIHFMIEFQEQNKSGWVQAWSEIDPNKLITCDKRALEISACIYWRVYTKVKLLKYPLNAKGKRIINEWQPAARFLSKYPNLEDLEKAVISTLPQEYDSLADKKQRGILSESEQTQWRNVSIQALGKFLPLLGLTKGEMNNILLICLKDGLHSTLMNITKCAPIFITRNRGPEVANCLYQVLQFICDGKKVTDIFEEIQRWWPEHFFRADSKRTIAIKPAKDDFSAEAVEVRLIQGQDVPLDLLIQFPKLLSKYGAY